MPDDFGFGHMKHCVAINTTSSLDQSLDIRQIWSLATFHDLERTKFIIVCIPTSNHYSEIL